MIDLRNELGLEHISNLRKEFYGKYIFKELPSGIENFMIQGAKKGKYVLIFNVGDYRDTDFIGIFNKSSYGFEEKRKGNDKIEKSLNSIKKTIYRYF